MSPRTGRPKAEIKKDEVIRCRITKELNAQLEKYCTEHNVSKSEVILKGIKRIMEQK